MIDLKKLEKLIGMMADNDLTEIELDDGTEKVQLKRGSVAGPVQVIAPAAAPAPAAVTPVPAPAPAAAEAAAPVAAGPTIDSPMVGTFYSASNPDSPAFIKPGDSVTADSVVRLLPPIVMSDDEAGQLVGDVSNLIEAFCGEQ